MPLATKDSRDPLPSWSPGRITTVKNGKNSNGFNIEDAMQHPVLPPDDPNHAMLKKFYIGSIWILA
jgi:hypothetical protein